MIEALDPRYFSPDSSSNLVYKAHKSAAFLTGISSERYRVRFISSGFGAIARLVYPHAAAGANASVGSDCLVNSAVCPLGSVCHRARNGPAGTRFA